jgi:hypothetical protein
MPGAFKTLSNGTAYLDMYDWYVGSMNKWVDWWLAITRKYFPDTKIYLCTGGDATTYHGSNFGTQCKLAAKHKAGVRITNEGDDFAGDFAVTDWVASAARFYDTYFGYEPAASLTSRGVVTRIFNTISAGSNHIHYYIDNIIRTDKDSLWLQYADRLRPKKAVIDVAMLYPQTELALTNSVSSFLGKVAVFRDITNLDIVDENMAVEGALDKYKVLVIADIEKIPGPVLAAVNKWCSEKGGVVVTNSESFEWTKTGLAAVTQTGKEDGYYYVDVGGKNDEKYVSGEWNGPESGKWEFGGNESKRWSGKYAKFSFKQVLQDKNYTLKIRGFHKPELTDQKVMLKLNGKKIADLAGLEVQEWSIPVKKELIDSRQVDFEIESDVWVPAKVIEGNGDMRQLGIGVDYIEFIPEGYNVSAMKKAKEKAVKPVVGKVGAGTIAVNKLSDLNEFYLYVYDVITGNEKGVNRIVPDADGEFDHVFMTLTDSEILILNDNPDEVQKLVTVNGKSKTVTLKPYSILSIQK